MKGKAQAIDDTFRQQFQDAYKRFSSNGERVLGFAYMQLDSALYGADKDESYSLEQLNFLPTDRLHVRGFGGANGPAARRCGRCRTRSARRGREGADGDRRSSA